MRMDLNHHAEVMYSLYLRHRDEEVRLPVSPLISIARTENFEIPTLSLTGRRSSSELDAIVWSFKVTLASNLCRAYRI